MSIANSDGIGSKDRAELVARTKAKVEAGDYDGPEVISMAADLAEVDLIVYGHDDRCGECGSPKYGSGKHMICSNQACPCSQLVPALCCTH